MILSCEGKVVITGVGKSGHVGRKIAATFASTGTPAFFMHSTEGVHGDLGMIERKDIVILISNSGETREVLELLPSIEEIGARTIAMTAGESSSLVNQCDYTLLYGYNQEADHLKTAPTTSSTICLALGDVLAGTLSKLKEFNQKDFLLYHPGGSLGKKLRM
nr:SIS domain-containing protein [Marinilactibacillus kalidii]